MTPVHIYIYEQVPKGEHPVSENIFCCDLKKKNYVKMKRKLCTKRNMSRKIVPLHVFF